MAWNCHDRLIKIQLYGAMPFKVWRSTSLPMLGPWFSNIHSQMVTKHALSSCPISCYEISQCIVAMYVINHLVFTFSAEPWISMVLDCAADTRVRDDDFFRNWVRLVLSAICDSSRLIEEVDNFREALRWLVLSSDALKSSQWIFSYFKNSSKGPFLNGTYRLRYRSWEDARTCFWWYSTASWAAISEVDTRENELLLATLASEEDSAVIFDSEAMLACILASDVMEDDAAAVAILDALLVIMVVSPCIISAWAVAAA